jgi:lipopolysaccharide transport system permease protein
MNPHTPPSVSIIALLLNLWRNRQLILQLTKRDISGRYRGSAIGIAWSVVTPVLMLAMYTFVFSEVFKTRWGTSDGSRLAFAINLFAGMIVHGLFAECINRAPTLILSNVNYVKRVVFPLEVLSFVGLGTALFHALISLAVLLGLILVVFGALPASLFWIVLVWLPLVLLILGASWLLASIGVFLRDVSQVTGFVTTILMFLSPIFYPATALREPFRSWLYLNPLTSIIEQTRRVVVAGQPPIWSEFLISLIFGSVVAWIGFFWFQKTRRGFADVL